MKGRSREAHGETARRKTELSMLGNEARKQLIELLQRRTRELDARLANTALLGESIIEPLAPRAGKMAAENAGRAH